MKSKTIYATVQVIIFLFILVAWAGVVYEFAMGWPVFWIGFLMITLWMALVDIKNAIYESSN